mmetsp:Transcript_51627/g.77020  ORF Transcript_51627/g.77020 Transcript_51627/m.77020 type:complete len:211 (-) Transcript_51627:138-770(-)
MGGGVPSDESSSSSVTVGRRATGGEAAAGAVFSGVALLRVRISRLFCEVTGRSPGMELADMSSDSSSEESSSASRVACPVSGGMLASDSSLLSSCTSRLVRPGMESSEEISPSSFAVALARAFAGARAFVGARALVVSCATLSPSSSSSLDELARPRRLARGGMESSESSSELCWSFRDMSGGIESLSSSSLSPPRAPSSEPSSDDDSSA